MQKLLDKLLRDEGKLSLLLLEAKQFAEEANDESFLEFINNEIEGYPTLDMPDYRKIQSNILCNISNQYGEIVSQELVINFSVLSQQLGVDVSIVYVSDGIAFIEENVKNLTTEMAKRNIDNNLVEMLNKSFQAANPYLKLVSASNEFGTSAIKFIITKVRQELIIGLQKLVKKNLVTVNQTLEINVDLKNVFVTYAWENDEHNDKVISFVDFLRKKGYNATMDRKESQEQTSINLNRMMIEGIQNSDKVIIILSPKYKEKAEKFIGGVGTEFPIIVEEIKTNNNKFVFVSFGNETLEEIVPTGIKGRDILDLKKDQDNEFNTLFAKLQNKNIITFSEVGEIMEEIKRKEIKPFRL